MTYTGPKNRNQRHRLAIGFSACQGTSRIFELSPQLLFNIAKIAEQQKLERRMKQRNRKLINARLREEKTPREHMHAAARLRHDLAHSLTNA